MAKLIRANLFALKKPGSYHPLHVTVAARVTYAVTGNFFAVRHAKPAGAHGSGFRFFLP